MPTMPNIAKVLKDEISRISRREANAVVAPIRKPAGITRSSLADLKKRVAVLEKETKRLADLLSKGQAAQPEAASETESGARITAKGMKSLRRKLGLAAGDFGRLLGISDGAVYSNEHGQGALRLRTTTKAAYLTVRGMGVKQAKKRIEETDPKSRMKAKGGATVGCERSPTREVL